MYIYERPNWPNFTWDNQLVNKQLMKVKFEQGKLLGKMENLGFSMKSEAILLSFTNEVLKTSEIEGEHLNSDEVRSSIAKRLGINIGGLIPSDRNTDGIVEVILDATQNFTEKLTLKRLLSWHGKLFSSMINGMTFVNPGVFRTDFDGPMQVVSGYFGKERVHFEAPNAKLIQNEIENFLAFVNGEQEDLDLVIKAGIAHLWFVTIHPFDDGNGRISRAITDMILSRSENQGNRFYSMSAQIRKERKSYYNILEFTQKHDLNITKWLIWFLEQLYQAIKNSDTMLLNVLNKAKFWENNNNKSLNERQIMMLNALFDGFKGNLTSTKWAKMTKCSQDTAIRDINNLIELDVLIKGEKSGRSTSYFLKGYEINLIEN